MSMTIHDEAVIAALKATNEGGYRHITGLSVVVILEAAAPHLLRNMRPLSLYEIERRDNPERMKAARLRMQEEARQVRREENARIAEHFRKAQEAAWQEGMLSQFEADLLGKSRPANPHTRNQA